jgi:tRNA(Ile)-lysidine synthase
VENKIEKIFQSKISSLKDSKFLIALSGGVDSMVLANLFLNNNLSFSVAHCNFNLRDKESDDDEKFIFNWSAENEIECYISKFNTTNYCRKNKFGIQEGARNLRYDWFHELKDLYSFDYIVTAHHLDDQIETYLINSMRGSGLNGLIGITEKTDTLLRPLLKILKNEILVYAKSNKIDFREDSSNYKNDYFRNMIRNLIIPQFKKFDDNVMLKFQTTIDNLNSTKIFAENILDQTKNRIFTFETDKIKVKIDDLKKLDPLEYYVHELFKDYKFDFKEIIKLFDSDSGKHIISNTHIITKNKKFLIITKND